MPANTSQETPWHTQTWFVVLVLWLVYPAGLILMWTQTTWHLALKWAVTLVPIRFIMVVIVFSFALVVEDDGDFDDGDITFATPVGTGP